MDDELQELAELLAHIMDASDAGDDGRSDPALQVAFARLKDARMEAREAERHASGDSAAPLLQAGLGHWALIGREAPDYLRRSKDIDVVCWLLEALVRLYGWPGLAMGMQLVAALVERFWETGAHPALSDDVTSEDRVAALVALNGIDRPGTLIQPVSMLPITQGSGESYAYWHYEAALALGRIADREARERRIAAGAVSVDLFVQNLLATNATSLKTLFDHAEQTLAAYQQLQASLRRALGDDAPSGSFITALLEGIISCLLGQATHVTFRPVVQEISDDPDGEAATEGGSTGRGGLTSRAAALDRVLEVADFFDRQEPNGLIGLSLREVVRRARLPLVDLLSELIPADDPRREFLMRAGIRTEEPRRDDNY